jgi:hypothetical protein
LKTFSCFVPLYIIIIFQAVFLVWLLSPMFQGSNILYHYVVRPMVLSKAARVERKEKGAEKAEKASKSSKTTAAAEGDDDEVKKAK